MKKRRQCYAVLHIVAMTTLVLTLEQPPSFAQGVVAGCGETLTDDAILAADLDCTGFAAALTVKQGAQLDLAGFSVTGAPIQCFGSCMIQGPGTTSGVVNSVADYESYPGLISVVSATVDGRVGWATKVLVTSSTVNGAVAGKAIEITSSVVAGGADYGVYGDRVTLTDSTVRDNEHQGVICKRCRVYGTTISGNGGSGIDCATTVNAGAFAQRDVGKLEMYQSVVDNNGFGPDFAYGDSIPAGIRCAQQAVIQDTSTTNNVRGVYVYGTSQGGNRLVRYRRYGKLTMSGSTVSGNEETGVRAEMDAVVSTSTIIDNGVVGVSADRKLLLDSTQATGNSTHSLCARSACPDVFSHSMPLLTNGTTCGTSGGNLALPSDSWGVCALD